MPKSGENSAGKYSCSTFISDRWQLITLKKQVFHCKLSAIFDNLQLKTLFQTVLNNFHCICVFNCPISFLGDLNGLWFAPSMCDIDFLCTICLYIIIFYIHISSSNNIYITIEDLHIKHDFIYLIMSHVIRKPAL